MITGWDILSVNKVINFVKSTPSPISIPKLDLKSLSITVFADARLNNLPDGGSQGGYIIFLNNKYNSVVPLSWNSTSLWPVARSTLAAETLFMTHAYDSAIFLSNWKTDKILKTKQHHCSYGQSIHLWNSEEQKSNIRPFICNWYVLNTFINFLYVEIWLSHFLNL